MNAPPWPTNPSVGQWWQNWIWNGSNWVCSQASGIRVLTTVFRASGPYQPSPGLVSLIVECVGGGGSGGNAVQPGSITWAITAGGGGSGGYSRKTLPAALVQGGVLVTIGAGGPAATNDGSVQPGPGGTTSFGAFCVANGGFAGGQAPWGWPGQPAPPGVGDIANFGAVGGAGLTSADNSVILPSGSGGQSVMGGAAGPPEVGLGGWSNGFHAYDNSGSGGSGAAINLMSTAGIAAGGAGGSGICIVNEFCFADSASDGSDCVNPQTVNLNARLELDRTGWPGPKPPRPPGGWGPGPFGGEDPDEG